MRTVTLARFRTYLSIHASPNTRRAATMLWSRHARRIVPTVALLAVLQLCWTWPLTAARHAQLQRILEKRTARMADRRTTAIA